MEPHAGLTHRYLARLQEVLAELDQAQIGALAAILKTAYDRQKTILILGNGGSAATASHMACDLNRGACLSTAKKCRALALTDALPTILAIGNDVDYESIFVEQLKNFAAPGDVVVAISGSGNSPNVLRGVEYANSIGCTTVGLCGFGGGKLKPLVHCCCHVAVDDMQIVEDVHLIVTHILMRILADHTAGL